MNKKLLTAMLLTLSLVLPSQTKAQSKLRPERPLEGVVHDDALKDFSNHPLKSFGQKSGPSVQSQKSKSVTQPAVVKHIPVSKAVLTATIPYFQDFDVDTAINQMTAIDADGDGTTWKQDGPSKYATVKNGRALYSVPWNAKSDFQANDWLLTPFLQMEAGKVYTLSYDVGNVSKNQLETYSLAWGTGEDVTAFTELVPPTDLVYLTNNDTTVTLTLRPTKTDAYRIGFHALSKKNFYNGLFVDNIRVTVAAVTSPDSVTSLALIPEPTGIHQATVSFTAPTTTVSGETLSELTKIDVFRDDSLISTLPNVEPGGVYSVIDKGMTDDVHEYNVVASNSDGEGTHAIISGFIGTDRPAYPKNLRLVDNLDNSATISWDEPHTGYYGYFVNPDSMRYNVYSVANGRIADTLASGIAGLSYKVSDIADLNKGDQSFLYYGLCATNRRNTENPNLPLLTSPTNFIIKGTPIVAPFKESFANGQPSSDNFMWSNTTGDYGWRMTSRMAYDVDAGSASFYSPYDTDCIATLGTGKISMQGMANPKLVFRYYNVPDSDMTLKVVVNAATQHADTVTVIQFKESTLPEGWQTVDLSMAAYSNLPYVWLEFIAQENSLSTPLIIDDIELYDVQDNDLSVRAACENKKINMGGTARVAARVENKSDKVSANAKLKLYLNGKLVQEQTVNPIDPFKSRNYIVEYATKPTDKDILNFKTVVEMNNDLDEDNNADSVSVSMRRPLYPAVDDLTATANGTNVELSWTAPDSLNNIITEGFEDYDPFIIDGIGNWETYDGDGGYTYYPYITSYANMGEPFAYQVMNPSMIDIDLSDAANGWNAFVPYDGDQYLVSAQSYTFEEYNGVPKDDWLISPQLDGKAQTISFWCRSLTEDYAPEKFQVLYSKSETATTDFLSIATDSVQAAWTRYTYALPAGTTHFAIRCISEHKYWFMLDDVQYVNGLLTLQGYNIYRDGELVASVDSTVHAYNDAQGGEGSHTYYVTVVYKEGESDLSNEANANVVDALQGISASMLYVGTADDHIVVRNATQNVCVYTLGGSLVAQGSGSEVRLPVKHGVYLVTVGAKAFKVQVR